MLDSVVRSLIGQLRLLAEEGARFEHADFDAPDPDEVRVWSAKCHDLLNASGRIIPDIVAAFRELKFIDRQSAYAVLSPEDWEDEYDTLESVNRVALRNALQLLGDAIQRLNVEFPPKLELDDAAPIGLDLALHPHWIDLMNRARERFPRNSARGPERDLPLIVAVVLFVLPHGRHWRNHLPEICDQLDKISITPPKPRSDPASAEPSEPVGSWRECLDKFPGTVKDKVAYARKGAVELRRARG